MNGSNLVERYQLQSFVPLNSLTHEHLVYLLRDHTIEVLTPGTEIFSLGSNDNDNIYLLYGEVELIAEDGSRERLVAGQEQSLFPLADHRPREVTAWSLTDCAVIRFDRDLLDEMLCWDQSADYLISDICARPEMDEDVDWMVMLLRSNLFYKVPPTNIEEIFDRFQAETVRPGEVILRQGETGECCFVIKEGEADVLRSEDERSRPEQIATLQPGRCFGDDALRRDEPRNATIAMRSNGVLMRLDRADYERLLLPAQVDTIHYPGLQTELDNGALLIDVRSQYEFERGHCALALNFPLNLLKMKSALLDKSQRYITCCNSGRRAYAAASLLSRNGFDVTALGEGIDRLDVDSRAFMTAEKHQSNIVMADGSVSAGYNLAI